MVRPALGWLKEDSSSNRESICPWVSWRSSAALAWRERGREGGKEGGREGEREERKEWRKTRWENAVEKGERIIFSKGNYCQ